MPLSHHDKEAQTLLTYFQQMLAENIEPPAAADTAPVMQQTAAEADVSSQEMRRDGQRTESAAMQLSSTPESKLSPRQLQTLERPKTQSLEALLSSVETAAAVAATTVSEPVTDATACVAAVVKPAQVQAAIESAPQTQTKTAAQQASVTTLQQNTEVQAQAAAEPLFDPAAWRNLDTLSEFQTLFFTAQGVRFAVPLIDLGGIFEYDKLTTLFGKPEWYLGMTDIRGHKINVVDTLRWVSPDAPQREDKYPYIIALGQSRWALGCDELEGNRTIARDAVKWRQTPGSRPWLAGIVKDERCALLHVQALIALFGRGMGQEQILHDFAGEA